MESELIKFTFGERDEYQRKAIAKETIALLSVSIKILPLIINSDWGAGKIELCHKLISLIVKTIAVTISCLFDIFRALSNNGCNTTATPLNNAQPWRFFYACHLGGFLA